MTPSGTTGATRRNAVDERRLELYLRGESVAEIARVLRHPEAQVQDDLTKLHDLWASQWGVWEIGWCVEVYAAIEHECATLSRYPSSSISEQVRLRGVGDRASARRLDIARRFQGRSDSRRFFQADEIRKNLKALARQVEEEDRSATLPVLGLAKLPRTFDQTDRMVERLWATGHSDAEISASLAVSESVIRERLINLQSSWEDFSNRAAGETFSRKRCRIECNLDQATSGARPIRERIALLKEAVSCCTTCERLLVDAGRFNQAPQASLSPEEEERIRQRLRDNPNNLHALRGRPFKVRVGPDS